MSTNNGQPRPAPVATLAAAEAAMIGQLHAVADRLDAVGQETLEAAVARVKASAAAAAARLHAARQAMNDAAAEVAACLDLMVAEISGELAADAASAKAVEPQPAPRFTFECERPTPEPQGDGDADPFGFTTLPGDVPQPAAAGPDEPAKPARKRRGKLS